MRSIGVTRDFLWVAAVVLLVALAGFLLAGAPTGRAICPVSAGVPGPGYSWHPDIRSRYCDTGELVP